MHGVAGVDTTMMSRALVRLKQILDRAGIRLDWVDCRPPAVQAANCNAAPRPEEAVVRLTSGRPTLWDHACGAALLPDVGTAHYVTVFVDCVREAADALLLHQDVVLACTLAHEIGHLMLGPGHESVGLMQAQPRPIDWQRATHGALTFTPAQERRLRQALIDRNADRRAHR